MVKHDLKLSPPRRLLLGRLVAAGGTLRGFDMTMEARRLASTMQREGLVEWLPHSSKAKLWLTLNLTEMGRKALREVTNGDQD